MSLDFSESRRKDKTFLSHSPGAFEQRVCPGSGIFASLFSKHANSRGSAREGEEWAQLQLTDTLKATSE